MSQTPTLNAESVTPVLSSYSDLPFYRKQIRIALKNCGIIDPKKISEYIARDGYRALARALTELSPDDVITIIKDSGLKRAGRSRICNRNQVGILSPFSSHPQICHLQCR